MSKQPQGVTWQVHDPVQGSHTGTCSNIINCTPEFNCLALSHHADIHT